MGVFLVSSLTLINLLLWLVFLVRFKKLFSADDIMVKFRDGMESLLRDAQRNTLANINLIEEKTRELKAASAEAERKVVEAQTKAAADVLKQEVAAYGGDADYVRAKLYEKAAPRVRDVVTGDSPGEIFGLPMRKKTTSVQQQGKGGAK